MFHNQLQQYTTQIKQLCQQMESSEQGKANQLRQIAQQLEQFSRDEAQGAQVAHELSRLSGQIEQTVQQAISPAGVVQQQAYQPATGLVSPSFQQPATAFVPSGIQQPVTAFASPSVQQPAFQQPVTQVSPLR